MAYKPLKRGRTRCIFDTEDPPDDKSKAPPPKTKSGKGKKRGR